jgi:hypothetical protein
MDKVQKPSNSQCYTPSSEPFRIGIIEFIDRYIYIYIYEYNWDSSVGIATGYELDDQVDGIRVPVGERIFSSPSRPDRLWGPPNLLSNW